MSIREGAIGYFAAQAAVQAVLGNPARLRPRPNQNDALPFARFLFLSDLDGETSLNATATAATAVMRIIVTAASYESADTVVAALWGVLGRSRLEAVGANAWDNHDVLDAHWLPGGGGDLELTPLFAGGDEGTAQRYLDLEITYNPVQNA